MKTLVILALCFAACSSPSKWEQTSTLVDTTTQPKSYLERVNMYQDSMSYSFTSGANGVLLKEDLKEPHPLSFFEPDSTYRVQAKFQKIEEGESFQMQTSTDRLPVYKPFGKLHFVISGDSLELTLYQSEDYPDYLFCPFKDLTNGTETYGAGRYLDFSLKDTVGTILDFNYCYNPLCVFNYNYSCPIPPEENHLKVRIEAGVKNWHE